MSYLPHPKIITPIVGFMLFMLMHSFFVGCDSEHRAGPVTRTEFMLDTVCTITIYEPQDPSLISGAFELCSELENLLSVTIEGSELWQVNHAKSEAVKVSRETAEIIREGIYYGDYSNGAFDITIGKLSGLWDFTTGISIPDEADISTARETVDYQQVIVSGDTVTLANPSAQIDLGGIAKGYIADRIAGYLIENGVVSAIIDLGGNIVTIGERQDGRLWRVGVKNPYGEEGDLYGVIDIGAASVVTSGIYERSFEYDGAVYHHILDPQTGYPVKTDIVSATVVSENSMTGDAMSTILLLAGSSMAEELFREFPGLIGSLLIYEDGSHALYGDISFTAAISHG